MSDLTSNQNFLQPSGFTVSISRENYPNLEYFAQTVSHPSIDIGEAIQQVRRAQIPYAGDVVTFGPLDITFLVDEDMQAYTEMYNWMERLVNVNQTPQGGESIPTEADIILSILTSHNNVNKRFKYYNCVPTSVSGLEMDVQQGAESPLTFSVSFRCSTFELV